MADTGRLLGDLRTENVGHHYSRKLTDARQAASDLGAAVDKDVAQHVKNGTIDPDDADGVSQKLKGMNPCR